MNISKIALTTLVASVTIAGFLASSTSLLVPALAERGGGESDNGRGLTGQSVFATSDGSGVGEGTSSNAHNLKDQGSSEGEFVRNQISRGPSN